jgi:hypothetical protein
MTAPLTVRKGYSNNPDTLAALDEVANRIAGNDTAGIILFASSKLDLALLGPAMAERFDAPILACTTAGELSPLGYPDHSISAVALGGAGMILEPHNIPDARSFSITDASDIGEEVRQTLDRLNKNGGDEWKAFGALLIDGLSVAEESVAAHLGGAMEGIPFVGGSAGDDLGFAETFVYHDGRFRSGGAVFGAFFTTHPFVPFKTQHFVPVEEDKLVITEADPENRIVREINGLPAAEEYARFVGLAIDKLEPMTFSKYPVMLKIGGDYYVRSIQKVNDDGSLTFYCAIDEGLVLTMAKGVDLIENLQQTFDTIKRTIPEPQLVIGCECILRRLEIFEKGVQNEAAAIMNAHNVVGFHTYGEQYNGVHVNQTFTGVALGA